MVISPYLVSYKFPKFFQEVPGWWGIWTLIFYIQVALMPWLLENIYCESVSCT